VNLPIRTLPIDERWDCTGCGLCCRGNIVPLDERDLKKLREQAWDQHPDFQGVQTVVREPTSGKTHRLAQRADGSCVFLRPDGLCAIHKAFGLKEKPLVCQTYPLQLIPLEKHAILTLRRSCPTAADDQGRLLQQYRQEADALGTERGLLRSSVPPPPITSRFRGEWSQAKLVTAAFSQLLQNQQLPLVRRLVHCLAFCDLLEECRPQRMEPSQFGELIAVLQESAVGSGGEYFADRQAPTRAAGILFRQAVANYLRLHTKFLVRETWGQRWSLLRMALKMARGKGETPQIHPDFPVASFDSLEVPLGHLPQDVQQPLNRYYEVNGASGQFTFASKPKWTMVDACRALVLTYPIALWMLRLCSQGEPPSHQQAIEMVTIIDRGQGYQPLLGRQHRKRISTLRRLGQLPRLVAWYAR
jgi:Fe-S-cluster containining protein